jgi:glycosyltransferase involved in cell wall biosynthesis
MKNKILFFFSTIYPYETTLKNEFKVLSRHFDKIYYFPSHRGNDDAWLPDNMDIYFDFIEKRINKPWPFFIKHFFFIISLFFKEATHSNNFFIYIKNAKTYMRIIIDNLNKAQIIENKFDKELLGKAVFYDYWFENTTLALSILKYKKTISKAICRTHRFDLYDSEDWIVPYRHYITKRIDKIYPVSQHGLNYLIDKEPSVRNKLKLYYLGVDNNNLTQERKKEDLFHIVSCSNFRSFKRVHLIPDVLKHIDKPIKWTHFGTGEYFQATKLKIKQLPKYIECELKGYVPNQEIFNFYKNNSIDLFLSLSISEGLPISMMEAVSFGIPVAALGVCGIPELVNSKSGILFDKEDGILEIAEKLKAIIDNYTFNRNNVRSVYVEKFNINKNLENFVSNEL